MGVVTFDEQYVFAIPPAKMFEASVLEAGTTFPKIMQLAIQSVVILEANGGPGTFKQVNFGESSKFKYINERIEELDTENFKYVTTHFEGEGFGESFHSLFNPEMRPDSNEEIIHSVQKSVGCSLDLFRRCHLPKLILGQTKISCKNSPYTSFIGWQVTPLSPSSPIGLNKRLSLEEVRQIREIFPEDIH